MFKGEEELEEEDSRRREREQTIAVQRRDMRYGIMNGTKLLKLRRLSFKIIEMS